MTDFTSSRADRIRNLIRYRELAPSDIPPLDVALLSKVMEHIEQHPDEHDQGVWASRPIESTSDSACGTAFCFAGHAVNMTMAEQDRFMFGVGDDNWDFLVAYSVQDSDGMRRAIPALARQRLGVSNDEGVELFASSNTMEQLRALVDDLIGAEQRRLSR